VNPCPPLPPASMALVGVILQYIENRRVINIKEAEKEIKEIIRDLFKYKENRKENNAVGK
jgi:hypothetical protein